ncbi:hypothetical protein [Grimontia marina]|nr:hypothetical protein [Grimontia marina]
MSENWGPLLLLVGALCGMVMVVGGITLLHKGAIKLANTSGEDAITIEFRKEIRISTQYPALAIFLIGLLFVSISIFMGKPTSNKLVVKGNVVGVSEPVKVSLKTNTWHSSLTHDGDLLNN